MNDTDERLWHPWLRINRVLRADADHALERGGVAAGQGRVQDGARAQESDSARRVVQLAVARESSRPRRPTSPRLASYNGARVTSVRLAGVAALARWIMDYLGYIQTWVWIWGVVSTSTVGVVIGALIARLPGVIVFVLALGAGVLTLLGLETSLIVYERVKEMLEIRYQRAVTALGDLRTRGVVLRNRPVASDAEVQDFIADFEVFETEALAAMKGAATRTDISWFRDLHEWTAPKVAGYNDEHAQMKAILDEKIRRMHQIASTLEAKIR